MNSCIPEADFRAEKEFSNLNVADNEYYKKSKKTPHLHVCFYENEITAYRIIEELKKKKKKTQKRKTEKLNINYNFSYYIGFLFLFYILTIIL